jgi:AcrR family transcriptional regulator
VPPASPARPVLPRVRYDIDSLTDVALAVFKQRGYDATSMEHLASAAGITKAAFYHHIGSKEELLDRGFDRALDALMALLDTPEATTGPALQRLRHVLQRLVELTHQLLPEVTVLLRSRGNSEIEKVAVDRRRQFDRRIGELIAEAQTEGSIRSDQDPQLVARLVIGMANSITEWYQPTGKLSARELAATIAEIALDGICVPPVGAPAAETTASETTPATTK